MKTKTTAALLAFFLGGFGVHRFYLGQPVLGVVYLLLSWTFIPAIIALIDFIIIITYSDNKFDEKYNQELRPQQTTYQQQRAGLKNQSKHFTPTVTGLNFPDRVDAIVWHLDAIDKGFINNDLELVNLSYAKLIESIRQQNINKNGIYTENLESVRTEYQMFRETYGYEYPQQFRPRTPRQKNTSPNLNGHLLINPHSNFKLHLFNAPEKVLKQILSILKDEKSWNKEKELLPIFTEYNVKCKEIEDYISKYKALYQKFIEKAKANSSEYKEASEIDKLDTTLLPLQGALAPSLHTQRRAPLHPHQKHSSY